MKFVRRIFKKMPQGILTVVKKFYYKNLIKRGKFISSEKEFEFMKDIVTSGSNVIDIGANIGHYTLLLSKLVGEEGRVLAFEPIPATFSILASNVDFASEENVTLINGAVGESTSEVRFNIPKGNLYQSHIAIDGDIRVMCFSLNSFIPEPWRVDFIKIDAEGLDEKIIESSQDFINKYRPIIMAEIGPARAKELVNILGKYSVTRIEGSHNSFFVPTEMLERFPI